jgi:signal transduction histidine kinase
MVKQLLWIHGENAMKYAKEPAEIEVKVWKDRKYAYVSIKDNGAGIAEEDIPKIFDRFYRVDKSRNKEIAGTGLGLAIAKWITDSHDGEILVESTVGEGTTFTDKFRLFSPAERK